MNTGNHYRNVSAASDRDYDACKKMNNLNDSLGDALPIETFMVPHGRFEGTHRAWNVALHYRYARA